MTIEESYAIALAWHNLSCAILQRAQADARYSPARSQYAMRARLYLLSDEAETLMEDVGLDVQATRDRLVVEWVQREMQSRRAA